MTSLNSSVEGRKLWEMDLDGKTGVCIWRKLGSFWNIVIFSAMGVAGGDIVVIIGRGVNDDAISD